jgi:phosphoribosylamine---glycine ligase
VKILVLGSGGREHALAWKIALSPRCEKVYLHPGNYGTRLTGFSPLFEDNFEKTLDEICSRLKSLSISLVVIGPEALLAEGYADRLRKEGFLVVGPDREGARLETSKLFAKEFMLQAGIPTAEYQQINSKREFLESYPRWNYPLVLKIDGLAAGKGVVVATTPQEAHAFAVRIWDENEFGESSILFREQFVSGREMSAIGLCDGNTFLQLSTATDYKRVGDNNTGPNTGGMGCISPSPVWTPELQEKITHEITNRVLKQIQVTGMNYRGALYLGLMVTTEGNPVVLEFNTRFGDPETQALLLRLESDFVDLLEHTARGTLAACQQPKWSSDSSVYVVAASKGYPGKLTLKDEIKGLEKVKPDVRVFFSGVREEKGKLVTGGGRVLGLGTLGSDLNAAKRLVYQNLESITWPGIHFRRDIGDGF